MYSLKIVYFYRNMSELCLYYLYVFDIVRSVGLINEYVNPKCTEGIPLKLSRRTILNVIN